MNPSFFLRSRSLPIFSYVSLRSLKLPSSSSSFRSFFLRNLCDFGFHENFTISSVFFNSMVSFLFLPGEENFNRGYDIRIPFYGEFLRERETRLDRKFPRFYAKSSRDKLVARIRWLDCFVMAVRLPLPRRLYSFVFRCTFISIGGHVCVKVFHEIVSCVYILNFRSVQTVFDNNSYNFHRYLLFLLVPYYLTSCLTIEIILFFIYFIL